MTNNEVYREGKNLLIKAGVDAASFEAIQLFEYCFEMDRQALILHSNELAYQDKTDQYFKLIEKRISGVPLQYILAQWTFMDIHLKVGEGVLIPREDTAVLVNAVVPYIKNIPDFKILDLCAGSGAISIQLSKIFPKTKIIAVEWSDDAIKYLYENIKLNNSANISVKKANVLKKVDEDIFNEADLVISNPPYIKTCEIESLQKEIQFEPFVALDGGTDGMKFYRAIAESWINVMKPGGILAVEFGCNQLVDISDLFTGAGLKVVSVFKDLAGLDRALVSRKL